MRFDIPMVIPESYRLQFQAQALPQTLRQLAQDRPTGDWSFEFPHWSDARRSNLWYLTLFQRHVVFSGNHPMTGHALLKIFQRYLPRFRSPQVQAVLPSLKPQMNQAEQSGQLRDWLERLYQMNLVSPTEAKEALWLHILADCDVYLFDHAGWAKERTFAQPALQSPIAGFEIETVLSKAEERQVWWHKLQPLIPSMDAVPLLNLAAVRAANLSIEQQQRLQTLVAQGETLHEIAIGLAQDSLETAKVFARLVSERFITLKPTAAKTGTEVFVVDDSPVLLKQFEHLVMGWGYSVQTFEDPTIALPCLQRSQPGIIFLDINMPSINGFELVKQIRRQPHLTTVPLVMLTAEKTLSNNWRSRLSGCRFLSKPLTADEISQFQTELRQVLAESLPIQSPSAMRSAPPLSHSSQIKNYPN